MKKLFSIITILVLFASCSNDVKFNDKALQGLKNSDYWSAVEFSATKATNGSLTITGSNTIETLTLKMPAAALGIYPFSSSSNPLATFTYKDNNVDVIFKTSNPGGNGQIKVTEYDGSTISGTFEFLAKNNDPDADQLDLLFEQGNFYKVPISN